MSWLPTLVTTGAGGSGITSHTQLSDIGVRTHPQLDTITGNHETRITTNEADIALLQATAQYIHFVRTVLEAYDPTAATPVGPADEDRYLSLATANGWNKDSIYQWDAVGGVWDETVPDLGMAVFVTGGIVFAGQTVAWNGIEWVNTGFANDHGGLVGLGDDDHLQYVAVSGRAGDVVTMTNVTQSTTPADGCLVLTGGLGVGKAINAAGAIKTTDATASTSTITGSIVSAGGMGLGGAINLPTSSASTMGRLGCGAAPDANIPLLAYRAGGFAQIVARNWNGLSANDGYIRTLATGAGGLQIWAAGGTEDYITLGNSQPGKQRVIVTSDQVASSTTTGALVVGGGGGFAGKIITGGGLSTTSATASTSSTTGALTVAGGAGIVGDVHSDGSVSLEGVASSLWFSASGIKKKIVLRENAAPANSYQYYGIGVTPNELRVQMAATTDTFKLTAGTSAATEQDLVTVGGNVATGSVSIAHTTASTTVGTGALKVAGGLGVGGTVTATNMTCVTAPVAATDVVRLSDVPGLVSLADYVKVNGRVGDTVVMNNATDSTGGYTGSLQLSGGMSVEKGLYVGRAISIGPVYPHATIPLWIHGKNTAQILIETDFGYVIKTCSFTVPTTAGGGIDISPGNGTAGDATDNAIGLGTAGQAHSVVTVRSTAASTSTTTGGLVVVGGAGVGGRVTATNMTCPTAPVAATDVVRLTDLTGPGWPISDTMTTWYQDTSPANYVVARIIVQRIGRMVIVAQLGPVTITLTGVPGVLRNDLPGNVHPPAVAVYNQCPITLAGDLQPGSIVVWNDGKMTIGANMSEAFLGGATVTIQSFSVTYGLLP